MDNFIILCIFLIFSFIRIITSIDSIIPSQSIWDGETLVSAGGTFELGFFSPGNSRNRYLGVWYKNISPLTVVWVANRETPLNNTSGVLRVNDDGVLMLLNASKSTVWSSDTSRTAENPIAQVLDSGNLVVKTGHGTKEENLLWQSFDHPCDTLLPGMKLGWNLATGLDRFLSSWKSDDDPSQGEYILKIDLRGYPQLVLMKGTVIVGRVGSWNGLFFTIGRLNLQNAQRTYKFILTKKEIFYEFQVSDISLLSRYIVTPTGFRQLFDWRRKTNTWELVASYPSKRCDNYALCGANSICNISNIPVCSCLKGFEPKHREEWNKSIWSNGCIRIIPLGCNSKDDFRKYTGMKLPDTSSSWYNKTMDLEECQKSCLANCSCNAYASLDIRSGGSGCLLWFDDLVDIRQFVQGGQDLYIRSLASELDLVEAKIHRNTNKKKLTGFAAASAILIMGTITFAFTICIRRKKLIKRGMWKKIYGQRCRNKLREEHVDLPTFDFSIIAKATDNFSSGNKLGEGGFGPVYKGTLVGGQDIAVKRLSKNSGQGLEEFKNEVMLIAKLQHRNLVRLLGCCIRGAEKILIYEYMPNKSLDYFISDATSRKLDWFKRFHIISGIARGLLYLHQDSRLRIIHRDLKTSNILLDADMNPKISDFGLARTLWGDQVEANTKRVVGTCGYMSPEYAASGHFSIKSDVFSFGVIVLEIVSGKKTREFSDSEHYLNLPGHAWKLWTEERPLELMDKFLGEIYSPSEVIRCIQVGLLCVQQRPENRPDMSSVVLMLNGEKLLPRPNAPGFYIDKDIAEAGSSLKLFTPNEMSLTTFVPR